MRQEFFGSGGKAKGRLWTLSPEPTLVAGLLLDAVQCTNPVKLRQVYEVAAHRDSTVSPLPPVLKTYSLRSSPGSA